MLIVEARDSVEVYVNQLAQVAISHPEIEGALVSIHPEDVEKVIAAIIAAYKEAKALRESPNFSLDERYRPDSEE